MALRSITITFNHFAPGDVEAEVVFIDSVNDREEVTYIGRNESDLISQVATGVEAIVAEMERR